MTSTRTAGATTGGDAARSRGATGIAALSVLAASLLLGSSLPALAAVDTCLLNAGAVAALQASVAANSGIAQADVDVSFVVGYSLTGAPVLCTNTGEVGIASVREDTAIPAAGTVDILAAEQASFLRYRPNRGAEEVELVEERMCHTVGVGGHTDCFILVARPDEPDEPDDPDARRITVTILEALAESIAEELRVSVGQIPGTVQVSVGIASQVCSETADELNELDACIAVRTSSSFNNRVREQLLP